VAVPLALTAAFVGVSLGGPDDSRTASVTADVNARRADGSTALLWAVHDGDAAEVERLIAAGADITLANDFGELLDVQFEMMALAWQTNRTNVITMKMIEEASMRTFPHLGVYEAFHPTSHWGGFPERIANLRLIQNWHTQVFAKFANRLAKTPDGDGSLLDHSIILFGSNMANSDAHNNDPLPQALIGRGGGVRGGQHLRYPQDTPHANLLVTMLERAGVPVDAFETFADSTGPFAEV
jgi:hypothetical protein